MLCGFFVEDWTFESNNVILGNQILPLTRGFLLLLLLYCYGLSLYHGSARGINLRSSQVFFEPVHFLIFPIYVVGFECSSLLMSGSQNEKKEKNESKGEKGTGPLNPL